MGTGDSGAQVSRFCPAVQVFARSIGISGPLKDSHRGVRTPETSSARPGGASRSDIEQAARSARFRSTSLARHRSFAPRTRQHGVQAAVRPADELGGLFPMARVARSPRRPAGKPRPRGSFAHSRREPADAFQSSRPTHGRGRAHRLANPAPRSAANHDRMTARPFPTGASGVLGYASGAKVRSRQSRRIGDGSAQLPRFFGNERAGTAFERAT